MLPRHCGRRSQTRRSSVEDADSMNEDQDCQVQVSLSEKEL